MQNVNYRNYLEERRGAHLIFYLSEGVLLWGGHSLKNGNQVLVDISFFRLSTIFLI